MAALTQEQIDKFWTDGVLVVEDAVSAEELVDLKQVFISTRLFTIKRHLKLLICNV